MTGAITAREYHLLRLLDQAIGVIDGLSSPIPVVPLKQLERAAIRQALALCPTQTEAAKVLGVSVRTMQYKLQEMRAEFSETEDPDQGRGALS